MVGVGVGAAGGDSGGGVSQPITFERNRWSMPFALGYVSIGYVKGRNIRFEYRYSNEQFDRLPNLAAELVRLKVDVIVTLYTQASLAARDATSTIPIVMNGAADPIGVGLIASLSHPHGNITGTSTIASSLVGKQFELLKQMVPGSTRIAALWNPANAMFQKLQLSAVQVAAQAAGVKLQLLEARAPSDFTPAFAAIDRDGTRALLFLTDPLFFSHLNTLTDLVTQRRLPSIYGARQFAEGGGLMVFGPDYLEIQQTGRRLCR